MTGDDALVALAHENFVASFRKLAEHCDGGSHRLLGSVFAFVTQLPFSLFNGCVVVEPAASDDLAEALRWVAEQRVPRRLFVAAGLEAGVAGTAEAHGLVRDRVPYPAMALHPIPSPPDPSTGVVVADVDEAGRDAFVGVGVAAGFDRKVSERMFSAAMLADPEVDAFVGYLDDRPVGYALAIRSEGASGVYNVGTLPVARRRGVGTALTWAAVEAGRRGGLDCVVLQSSEMARTMYEAMGFRNVVDYAVFREPIRSTGQETPVPPSPQ
jgi:ribosomal protein S18 acetylase RimI-like enzyme